MERFWAKEGCLIWQPYYTQVGAGTMNPATFLRVLGPEPWRVAYVETTVRPDDARYGENPNRMGIYYQYQVILKPDPGNPQELFLRSLEALGIDPKRHDIRFVEDRWEAPTLGAWGLGWEVWLDGLEITQFTYFQQAGGLSLDPVSVEITYGLERILMAIQRVSHFSEIRWDGRHRYGELLLGAEQEYSRYFFEGADVDRLQRMFSDYEHEARRSLGSGLVLPAYDYLLKCSHTFNVLDARGSVGVAERASYFGVMREIARDVARAYLAERERLGYPWVEPTRPKRQPPAPAGRAPLRPASFVLEIGTEELPVGDLRSALAQLEERVPRLLDDLRLTHRGVEVLGTPRRLVVHVRGLASRQADRTRTVKGPPAARAFDEQGNPTAAAEGFARSAGVPVKALKAEDLAGGRYVVAEVVEPGRPAGEVLKAALPSLLADLEFEQPMRWNTSGVEFARPVRWLVALHGTHLVRFAFAGLASGRTTRGLRGSGPSSLRLRSAADYFTRMRRAGVILEPKRREATIARQLARLSAPLKAEVPDDPDLLAEVAHMLEAPVAVRGSFDRSHLSLPREVLVSVMKRHQRYFPVTGRRGLLPHFLAVANGVAGQRVVQGNEDVLRARFVDAAYFVSRDARQPLAAYIPRLRAITYQAELGSMLDRSERIRRLVEPISEALGLSDGETSSALRAAELCKADLATQMVKDMTSLQGTMGAYYAARSGESEAVARAIGEHYRPRTSGDRLPGSAPGVALAVADRLESLMGLFAVGLQPSGTRDPYGLRRTAIGLVQILAARPGDFDLKLGLGWASQVLARGEAAVRQEADCLEFILGREQGLLLGEGWPHEVVRAVLAAQGHNPRGAFDAVRALAKQVQAADWPRTLQAYARCARITRGLGRLPEFREEAIGEAATRELYQALLRAEASLGSPGTVDGFLEAFRPMIPAIDRFFEQVLVMAEEQAIRENRLALLRRVVKLAEGVADLSQLEGF